MGKNSNLQLPVMSSTSWLPNYKEMKQEYGSPQPQMMSSEGYEPLPFHTPQRPTDTPNSVAGTYDQPIQSPPYNENNSEMEMGDIDLSFIDVRDILNLDANFQPMNQHPTNGIDPIQAP